MSLSVRNFSKLLTGDSENNSAFGNLSDKLLILNSSETTAFNHFLKVDILKQAEQILRAFLTANQWSVNRAMQIRTGDYRRGAFGEVNDKERVNASLNLKQKETRNRKQNIQ